MTQLTNLSPAASYGDILTTTNNGQGLTTNLQNLQDGFGNNSSVQIATNSINFLTNGGRTLQINGVPLTVSATTLNQLGPSIVSGTLTPAQVYAMSGASILVLAAPGPGSVILINKFVVQSEFNSVSYSNGGIIFLQYSQNGAPFGNNNASGSITASVITNGESRIASTEGQIGDLASAESSEIINSPICITNDTEAFSNGDSDVNYYILYTVINLL